MVHKIVKLIFLFILMIFIAIFAVNLKGNIETNMLKTILPESISQHIVPIANKSLSTVRIVFEAETFEELENLKSSFMDSVDKDFFEPITIDISKIGQLYLTSPTNFLSDKTRKMLKEDRFDEIYEQGLQSLYNPGEIQLSTLDKDPYLLFDDFINSIRNNISDTNFDKNYDTLSLKIKSNEGLSPDLANKKIAELMSFKSAYGNIYFSGTPVHSYVTSKNAAFDINLICLFSSIFILCLIYFYFRNIKLILPIVLSIIFGLLTGYVTTKLWFSNFQIITMVFSTALIGIGIDYSFHYIFAEKIDKDFIKNLALSLFTTIIPFGLMYITGIQLLCQIAVFTISGLIAIFLFVIIFYPCFDFPKPRNIIIPNFKLYRFVLYILIIVSLFGFFRLKFNDSLTSLYTPSKNLLHAEQLYNQVSGADNRNTQILVVKGDNLEDILVNEEKIIDCLNPKNYISLSKFIPSTQRQKENFELVNNLYVHNLYKYGEILTQKQIFELKNKEFSPVIFEVKAFPYLSELLLDDNTSLILVFDQGNIPNSINIKTDVEKFLKSYRIKLLKIFPVVLSILVGILSFLYGLKRGLQLIIPPAIGIFSAIGLSCLLGQELNLFSLIALFLVLGFTMDYSIFRVTNAKHVEDAVLVSCLTTSFSFLMLSFTGFKLLSAISLILFLGITISYLAFSLFKKDYMVESNHENNQEIKQ